MGKFDFRNRQESSKNDDGKHGFSGKSVFKFGDKQPKMYEVKDAKGVTKERHKIDIVPFKVSNKMNPAVIRGDAKVGGWDYVLDIYVHKSIGPNKDNFLCLRDNFRQPCPLCEEAKRLYLSGDVKGAKALNSSRRVVYNVIDRMQGASDEMQILDMSFSWFEKELATAAANQEDDDGAKTGTVVDYASPDEGKRILFSMVDTELRTTKGEVIKKPAYFKFKDRENIENRLDDAYILDSFLNIPTAEEMKASLFASDSSSARDDDDDDFAPTQKKTEVKAEAKTAVMVEENPCPHGHVFGKDNDGFPECDSCKVWKMCARAQN